MLRLTALSAGYGDLCVVHDVTLEAPDGSVTVVLGPNGAGKSTLLGATAGVIACRTGTVMLDGTDISHVPVHRRRALGLCHVTEGRNVFPRLTVAQNLKLFAAPGTFAEVVDATLETFPALRHRLSHAAGTLSGGERQMLALARATASGAHTLLLDEVSIGLAPRVADEVFAAIRRAADAGACVVVVEQRTSRALSVADRVFVMREGRVVASGSPASVASSDLFAHYAGADVTT